MTKKELASKMAKVSNYSAAQCEEMIDVFTSEVLNAVQNSETVFLRGFGSFKTVTRKSRKARNITKGTEVVIPEREEIVFKSYTEPKEV